MLAESNAHEREIIERLSQIYGMRESVKVKREERRNTVFLRSRMVYIRQRAGYSRL